MIPFNEPPPTGDSMDSTQDTPVSLHRAPTTRLRSLPRTQRRTIFPHHEHYGDVWPRPKLSSTFRMAYANINGFNTEVYNNLSVHSLRQWLGEVEPDIFLGCEAQINWRQMPWDGKLRSWFRTGEQMRCICGYNTNESHLHNRRQYGGTFILALGQSSSQIIETGVDPSGLGRWCWVRFSSQGASAVKILVVYRPVRQSREHTLSVYMQHSRHFEQQGDHTCPRRAFLRDLETEIHKGLALGDRMIIAGDFNDNVARGHLPDFFRNLGFRDAILPNQPQHSPLPATMSRGTTPVDAVWLSPDIPNATAATWLSFQLSPGDHRAAIVDFHAEAILSDPVVKVFRPGGRRLNTKIPSVKHAYTRLLEQHFSRHGLLQKLYRLATTTWEHRWHEFASHVESLDRLRTEGMRFAEKRCRRFRSGGIFFSPEIDKWYKLRRLYSQTIQYHAGRRIRRATILKLATKCSVDNILRTPVDELHTLFKTADLTYRALKPRSAELRDQFLRSRLSTVDPGSSHFKAIKTLLHHEHQREVFRFLTRLQGIPQKSSVTNVQEIDHRGVLHSYTTQPEVEQALQRCLESRFSLTDNSPIMQPYLFHLLGNGVLTPAGQRILKGEPIMLPRHLSNKYTKWLLTGMACPNPPVPPIEKHISILDFQRYWSRTKEKTSSSLSGLHFGHYKAAASSDMLSEFHAFFTEIVFRSGYSLKRWQRGLQVILEKKPGVRLVNKLRAILLMEADFNFGNKLFVGSRMIHQVRDHLPRELYGGVKGRRVEFMALSRRLMADILRQTRRPGAVASVDAQSCYDRITHSTASLCCQRWGVSHRIMESMLSTIQGMRFYLRTGYGDSTDYNGGGRTTFQGICQGNGAGPAVWLAISAVLILLLREKTQHHPIRGAFSSASLVIAALLFVDDTDLFVTSSPDTISDPTIVVQRLQFMIDVWHGLLQASGGSLSAEKCSWSLAAFRWNAGRWSYHSSTTLPAEIFINDGVNGNRNPIRRIEPNVATTSVGVEQTMDGSMKEQLTILAEAVNRWSDAISQGNMPRHIAWAAIRNKIWPSLRFPLASTTLTQQQGRQLMGRLYRHLLPKLGANRNIPAAVRYGPCDMAGLDLPDPYIYQGSQQVSLFYQLYPTDTNEGHLLRASLEHLQLEIGIGTPVLLSNFESFGYLATHSWLKSLWEFLWTHKIRLEVTGPLPHLCREHDQFIMEALTSCQSLSKEDIASANRCRLHLHLIVFSDFTTGGGNSVLDNVLHGRRDPLRTSQLEWPEERPSNRDYSNWRKCLSAITTSTPLHLGRWLAEPHYSQPWWYDEALDVLYRNYQGAWWVFRLSESRHTRTLSSLGQKYRLSGVQHFHTRGPNWCRTTVKEFHDGRVSHQGYSTQLFPTNPAGLSLATIPPISWETPDNTPLEE